MSVAKDKLQDYGRMGGLQTLLRYGRQHFSDIGRLGGRPRQRDFATSEVEKKRTEVMATEWQSLAALRSTRPI